MRTDDTSISLTAVDNALEPNVQTLRDPSTSSVFINKYFNKWNDTNVNICYPLPFCKCYNDASFNTEKLVYDYLESLQEPMLIINSYQHNVKIKGGLRTGICGNEENGEVREIDILVVHKVYGLLLFEVKDVREVQKCVHYKNQEKEDKQKDKDKKATNKQEKSKKEKKKKKESEDRCPVTMIEKGEQQLMGCNKDIILSSSSDTQQISKAKECRWEQIKRYLHNFFNEAQVKGKWRNYWNMTDNDIDVMLENIVKEASKRSFLCVFSGDGVSYENDLHGNVHFQCVKENCCCSPMNSNHVSVTKCCVLVNELRDFKKFQRWWKFYFKQDYFREVKSNSVHLLQTYEFLLNRFGLDFFVSDYVYKSLDIRTADDRMNSFVQQIPILWEPKQLEILKEAELAFINGYPGSGKTILMTEKVRTLLINMKENDATNGGDTESRILIITGNSKALKAMLEKSEEYLKRDCGDETPERLYIFTAAQFQQWCKDKIINNNNKRFRHIFVDESHDLEPSLLLDILENNMTRENNNRHFWILYDACQNTRITSEFPEKINFSIWNNEENHFKAYFLRYIFRSTQNQFLQSYLPCLQVIPLFCTNCVLQTQLQQTRLINMEQKIVCNYCHPELSVNTVTGPLQIEYLLPSGDWPTNIAKLVMQAFVITWRNVMKHTQILCEKTQYVQELRRLCGKGLFKKTAVLTKEPEKLKYALEQYLSYIKFEGVLVCNAEQFYKLDKGSQANCLTVDTWTEYKGLEWSVVIMLDPFNDWPTLSDDRITLIDANVNEFLVSSSRANCCNVIITKEVRSESNLYKGVSKMEMFRRLTFVCAQNKLRECHIAEIETKKTFFDILNRSETLYSPSVNLGFCLKFRRAVIFPRAKETWFYLLIPSYSRISGLIADLESSDFINFRKYVKKCSVKKMHRRRCDSVIKMMTTCCTKTNILWSGEMNTRVKSII